MVRYIAGKRLNLGTDWREIGDPVPEAAGWRNLRAYLNGGAVILIEDDDDDDVVSSPSGEEVAPSEDAAPSLGKMTKNELRDLARERGVKLSGTKQDLIDRLS